MTAPLDLRKYYCRKCNYTGWINFDAYNLRFVYTKEVNTVDKNGRPATKKLVYTFAKKCECLVKINAGHYN